METIITLWDIYLSVILEADWDRWEDEDSGIPYPSDKRARKCCDASLNVGVVAPPDF
jgi:hypothetical protein